MNRERWRRLDRFGQTLTRAELDVQSVDEGMAGLDAQERLRQDSLR